LELLYQGRDSLFVSKKAESDNGVLLGGLIVRDGRAVLHDNNEVFNFVRVVRGCGPLAFQLYQAFLEMVGLLINAIFWGSASREGEEDNRSKQED